jgi:L-amino acid N-acyltransferase YncA
MDFRIESLQPEDWAAVKSIYIEGINSGNATFETSAPEWETWNKKHLSHSRLAARRIDGPVLGWVALTYTSSRSAYAGVAEVSVYIATAARGLGIGKALLQAVIASSEQAGIWTLQSGILAENTASIRLHETAGFRLVGRREKIARLAGVWRDVVLYERRSRLVGQD